MASKINVGDTVRINEKYNEVLTGSYAKHAHWIKGNKIGTEFMVTDVRHDARLGHYALGDPNGWGVVAEYLDVVKGAEADRLAKVEKTSVAIRTLGERISDYHQSDHIDVDIMRELTDLLDDITDATIEERA